MSFADLESGNARPTRSLSSTSGGTGSGSGDGAFTTLQSSLSLQVFKINSNVQGILKLVDQLGTGRDSAGLRKGLHDLTETTRALVKRGSDDVKKLASLQANLPDKPQLKTSLQKTSHDFQVAFVAFQRAQQLSAERQRTVVDNVKQAVDETERPSSPGSEAPQAQLLAQAQPINASELAHQESLIQEREAEIREIETGIHELHEIFRDLGTLVGEQGGMLDNVENNIYSIANDTSAAADELTTAHEYQKKAGRRAACLMIILVIVVAIVLLAILS